MAAAMDNNEDRFLMQSPSLTTSEIAVAEDSSIQIPFAENSIIRSLVNQTEYVGLEEIEDEDPFEALVAEGMSQLGRSADGTMQVFLALTLQDKNLTSVEELSRYNQLQVLNLSHNQVSDLTCLSNLPYLISLDASHNELTSTLDFKSPLSLREVNLSHNKIKEISDLSMHKCLNKLIMDYNAITEVNGLEQCHRLKILSLSGNQIEKISGLNNLPLTYLDLSRNKIKRIENIGTLNSLQTVDLSHNSIRSLKGLQSHDILESIKLANNEIIDLSEVRYIRDLTLLRLLDLSSNPIQDLPDYRMSILFRIPSITELDQTCISAEEKVKAQNLFKPSREMISARDHMMNVLHSYQQPIKLYNSTLSSVETPYPMLVLTGPSGCGKRILVQRLCQEFPNFFGMGVCTTTRGIRENEKVPRKSEVDGVDYHFVTRDEFEKDFLSGKFIETCVLYNNHYGITRDAIENVAKEGLACVFHMELEGVMVLKNTHFEPRYVLILPETEKVHEDRMRSKEFYSDTYIYQTLERLPLYEDMNRSHPGYFDMTICCDDLDDSYRQLKKIVLEYLGLSPVNSTASHRISSTHESVASDLSSVEIVQSSSTTYDKDNSTNSSQIKPQGPTGVTSRGLPSSRASRLTGSGKSQLEAASIQRRFNRMQAATVGITSTSNEQLSKLRFPVSASDVPQSWFNEDPPMPTNKGRAVSAPYMLNSSNKDAQYEMSECVQLEGDSESETVSEISDMSSAHAGYHMVDEDDDEEPLLSSQSSRATSASTLA